LTDVTMGTLGRVTVTLLGGASLLLLNLRLSLMFCPRPKCCVVRAAAGTTVSTTKSSSTSPRTKHRAELA
jgi:hypothetical protein